MNQLTEEQIRKWQPIVKGRVISLIGNGTPDWEDLYQDIMLSMTKAVKIFREDCDLGTLFYVVTMRRYYDYLREKYKRKGVECYLDYALAAKDSQKLKKPDRRIARVDLLLGINGLTKFYRELLEAVKKTLLSGRIN